LTWNTPPRIPGSKKGAGHGTKDKTNEEVDAGADDFEEFNELKAQLSERNDRQASGNQGINGMLNGMVASGDLHAAEKPSVAASFYRARESARHRVSGDGARALTDDEVGKNMLELSAPGAVPRPASAATLTSKAVTMADEETT